MPPTTTSTARSTSFAAAASATVSSVALSSTNNSTGRPSRPPRSLMSSITILATLTLAMPMNDRAPVWSVTTPTRAERLMVVIVVSRPVGAEQQCCFGLAEMSGFLEDRRDLGVGHELRPPCFVPVEERPDAVLFGGIAEHRRTLRAVQGPLLSALLAEHIQESVDVLDGRCGQDHDCSPHERFAHRPVWSACESFSGSAA